jgi:glycerol-3-phosphate dehydrogenase subunit C
LSIKPVIYNSHCCGLPLLANGDRTGAHRAFLRNIQLLKPYVDQGYQVVCTCPTCGLALKKFYAEELGTEDAEQLAAATYDYAEYLENHICELEGLIHPVEHSFIFHLPCHTQAQGTCSANLDLVRLIPGLKLEIVDKCCGQSGTYGYKGEKREVARGISTSLAQQIKEQSNGLNTKTVLTPCSSCSYRISLDCGIKAEHPLLLIWKAAVKKAAVESLLLR